MSSGTVKNLQNNVSCIGLNHIKFSRIFW